MTKEGKLKLYLARKARILTRGKCAQCPGVLRKVNRKIRELQK